RSDVALEPASERGAEGWAENEDDRERDPVSARQVKNTVDRGRKRHRDAQTDRVAKRARARREVGAKRRPWGTHDERCRSRPFVADRIQWRRPFPLPGDGQVDRAAQLAPDRRPTV